MDAQYIFTPLARPGNEATRRARESGAEAARGRRARVRRTGMLKVTMHANQGNRHASLVETTQAIDLL
jgi:hypothetical protein